MSALHDQAGGVPIVSPHRLVRASAGSGKTFQLTNVLLTRILAGEDPGSLLATTFTRAAAGEILHRVLARLSDAALDSAALDELRAHIDAELTHARCAEALEAVIGAMHRLSVLTIDAFFSRLASSFSLELGVPPGWRMLDEEEDARLRAGAVDRALRDAPFEDTIELLRALHGRDIRAHAHKSIMGIVADGYAAYLETRADEAVWSAVRPVGTALDVEALAEAIRRLEQVAIPMTKSGTPDKRWTKAIAASQNAAVSADWELFLGKGLGQKVLQGDLTYYSQPMDDGLALAISGLIEHARYTLTLDHAKRTRAALDLLRRFDSAYAAMKRAAGGLTFDDPPRLLLEADTTGDLEHLYFRLDARLRHVLLDEFQDTSMMQFRLIEPVLDELLSQATEGRSVFCVGDAKQSLYAWREAEPTLLPALADRWPTLHEETLAKSWRSSPIVLDAVNEVFARVQDNPAMARERGALAAAEEWDDRFDLHSAAKPKLPGAVRLSVANEPEDAEFSSKEANRAALATAAVRVKEARERAPGATIAVLVRRAADLRTILGMLKAGGVDASEQRGNPLVDTPAVAAAASMLRYIDHPGHTAGFFHAVTTPLGAALGLTDPRDDRAGRPVAARLRRRIAERGCAPVLAEWHEACIGDMDARSAARFEQLIDLAEAFDTAGRGGPADLADLLETRRVDEPGRAPVRVMTIHGAKGLEFDIVVLPLVLGKHAWDVSGAGVLTMRDAPLGPVTRVTRYPNATMRALHPDLEAMHDRAMQRQVNEELCCLYVAATRAKRCLELVVPADKNGRAGEPLGDADWRLRPDHLFRFALAPELPATPGAALWTKASEADWADDDDLRRDARPEAPPRAVALRVRAPERRSATRLAGATPSRERAGRPIDAASLLVRHDPRGRTIGDLVHRWFETIEWIEDATPDEAALHENALRDGFDADAVERALGAFRSGLAGESLRESLSREAWLAREAGVEAAAVHLERPFAVRDEDRLLEGRFDRLVIGLAGGAPVCAEVLDFKTDAAARGLDASALAEYAETHRAQMEAYRRAAALALRLDSARVATTLAFTGAGAAVRLAPL
jgi:ATP-dependent exoDNAse (exonuclease V) beta subunit